MTARARRRGRCAAAAAVLLPALVVAACTGGDGDRGERSAGPGRQRPASTTTAPAAPTTTTAGTAAGGHPLGAKWNWYQYRDSPSILAGIERLGGGSTFLELVWCYAERDDGRPGTDWSLYDGQVRQAADLGYEAMIKLRTGTCALTGGADDGSPLDDPSALPADPVAYDAFVAEAVARYAAQGVHRWAIENEVDARNSWSPAPAEYEAFARRVAGVVREADPDAVVYDSGLSGTVYGVSFAADRLEEGNAAGAADLYEGSYRRGVPGSQRFPPGDTPGAVTAAAGGDLGRRVQEALDVTARLAGDGVVDRWQLHWYEPVEVLPEALADLRARLPDGFPIEAWEAGVYWPGADYDPAAHAAETVRLVAELLAQGVERVVYLPVFYTVGGRQPQEIWRGLYEPSGQARPAAAAFETMTALTSDAKAFTALGDTGLGIDRPDGSVAVVWDRTLPPPPAGATATDPTGTPVPWSSAMDVGDAPLVVRSPQPLEDLRADLDL
jgi:hypothetical protein